MTIVMMTGCNNSSSGSNETGDSNGIENSNGTTASNGGATSGGSSASDSSGILTGTTSLIEIEDMFTSRDKEVGYDE